MIRTNKGFTMIELMVVIVIMGVLAVLAIPKLTDVITKAKFGEIPIVVGTWEHAMLAYQAETGAPATALSDLPVDDPTSSSKWFSYSQTGQALTSVVQTNKKVGPYTGGTSGQSAVSTMDTTNNFKHTLNGFDKKYMPNFPN